MSFVTPSFLPFLVLLCGIYWAAPTRRLQNLALTLGSLIFAGLADWRLPLLLGGSVALDYRCALAMSGPRRRLAMALSLVGNLGMLGLFKYLGWFTEGLRRLTGDAGPALEILLPVGLSFFTFQTLSYSVDVYRGRVQARSSLLDLATFICAFPQLVAGPIERAGDFLPQVERRRVFSAQSMRFGLGLLTFGAFLKLVIADRLGAFVDQGLAAPGGAVVVWAGTLGFSVQILADFAGYSAMARGIAALFGLRLTKNFDRPYLARTPSQFWRRWHISLSRWFHDYVYLPLKGDSAGQAALAAAVSLSLSGLWHGAAWNFVAWGAFHALLLLVWRHALPRRPGAWALPLFFVCTLVGWSLFRAPDLNTWWTWVQLPVFVLPREQQVLATSLALLSGGGLAVLAIADLGRSWARTLKGPGGVLFRGLGLALGWCAILLFAQEQPADFLYYRF